MRDQEIFAVRRARSKRGRQLGSILDDVGTMGLQVLLKYGSLEPSLSTSNKSSRNFNHHPPSSRQNHIARMSSPETWPLVEKAYRGLIPNSLPTGFSLRADSH